MSFDKTTLSLLNVAPGYRSFLYVTTTDAMATVIAGSYFDTGPDDGPKLVAGDMIYCICSDGNMWLKVDQVVASSGAVSCFFAGGNLPIRTYATGTGNETNAKLKVGYYEVGTSIATASRLILPTPYPGAEVKVFKVDSGTFGWEFIAGASASDVSLDASDGPAGGGTGVTYDGTNRSILLNKEGEHFHVVGTSTSRWRLQTLQYNASAVSEGASVYLGASS